MIKFVALVVLLWVSTARAGVTVHRVATPWADNLDVYHYDGEDLPLIDEMMVARGQQVHLAYWVHHTSGEAFSFRIDKGELFSAGLGPDLPTSAIDIRLLEYIDVAHVQWDESGAGIWTDPNANGYPTRDDWEEYFQHYSTEIDSPSGPARWQEVWLDATATIAPDEAKHYDAKLYRLADPLPLLDTTPHPHPLISGLTEVDVPSGEARIVWVTITVPDDQPEDWYQGRLFDLYRGEWSSIHHQTVWYGTPAAEVDFDLSVPCWDTIQSTRARLWDYSYRIGGDSNNESWGIETAPGVAADARAELRTMARHNSLYWPIGIVESSHPRWNDMINGMLVDFARYELHADFPSTTVGRPTILLGLKGPFLVSDWKGKKPEAAPHHAEAAWFTKMHDFFVDLEDDLKHGGLPIPLLDFVVIPIDEPILPGSTLGHKPFPSNYGFHPDTSQTDYFRAVALAARTAPFAYGLSPKILVNHPPAADDTNTQAFLSEFEKCAEATLPPLAGHFQCVDIWMQHRWHDPDADVPPMSRKPHAMQALRGSSDAYWFYEPGAWSNTYTLQSGMLMHKYGFSGSAQWAFFAANNNPGFTCASGAIGCKAYVHTALTSLQYAPHTWNRNQPTGEGSSIFHQFNQVYIVDPSIDDSVPAHVPNAEANGLLSPGRKFFARRQAFEHYKMIERLYNSAGTQPPGTPQFRETLFGHDGTRVTALKFLTHQATDPCLATNSCDSLKVSIDELDFVVREWLGQHPTCGSNNTIQYWGDNPLVELASGDQVWLVSSP